MKSLVTGSKGFIGSHLLEALIKRGHTVSTLDRIANNSTHINRSIEADILDRDAVRDAIAGQDLVFHMAAVLGTSELVTRARDAVDVNIGGTINVLDGCRAENARLVFVSKPNPWLNTYSITKHAAEQFCLMYRAEFQVPVTIVKPFNVYGPRESVGPGRPQKMIPTSVVKALNNEPLTVFGTGEQVNDYIYIDDVVRLICELSMDENAINGTYDIGTGMGQTVNDVCDLIMELTGSHSKVQRVPMRPGETTDNALRADLTTIKRAIPIGEFVSLQNGLYRTVEHYKSLVGD